MAKEVTRRRGTTAEHDAFIGAEGEITVDTTKDTVVVHDGSTAGGFPLAKESELATAGLPSGTTQLFYQSTAPVGWTKDTATTLNNSALRVVTSTAWATGKQGATAFDSVFGAGKVAGSHTLVESEIPSHTHSGTASSAGAHIHTQQHWTSGSGAAPQQNTGGVNNTNPASGGMPNTTSNGAHTHSLTINSTGSDGSHNHTLSLDLNYINIIIATKD